MAQASTPLIARDHLAELNGLRDAPGWIRLTSHLVTIVVGGILWRAEPLPWGLRLLGLLASGIGLATCFAPLHECGHRTVFRSKRLNDAVAWCAGVLSFYNSTFYRRYHQWHHRFTHQPGLDPELDDPVPTTAWTYLLEVSGWQWWTGKFAGYVSLLWGDLAGRAYLSPESIPQVRRSVRVQFLVYGLLLLASLIAANGFLWWSWLLPLAVGQPFLRLLLLAEHSGCSFGTDGTTNTRTTLTIAPVRWLMWNMPFHAEHHLYPSLPFHALPAAHRWTAPHLSHLDPGYVAVHRRLLRQLPSLALPR